MNHNDPDIHMTEDYSDTNDEYMSLAFSEIQWRIEQGYAHPLVGQRITQSPSYRAKSATEEGGRYTHGTIHRVFEGVVYWIADGSKVTRTVLLSALTRDDGIRREISIDTEVSA